MENRRILSKELFIMIPLGILINLIGVRLALALELPLFLDSIGTILTAVLGGYLPGIAVGYLSNVINGVSDPITMYYGIVSVLIAIVASWLADRRVFTSLKKTLVSALLFAAIGGGLGSVLTWLLYGFSFGSGISAPYAIAIWKNIGFTQFWSQFTADMVIDVADKIITVFIIFAVIRLLPLGFLSRLPHGVYSIRAERATGMPAGAERSSKHKFRHSLESEMLILIISAAVLLGTLSIGISYQIYKDTMVERYKETCTSAVLLMERAIDGNQVNLFLNSRDESNPGYTATERELIGIRESFPDVQYMYVYQIREDGCHVVFDLDTPDLKGEHLGNIVGHDEDFNQYMDRLLEGKEIPPIISQGTYGWLLTVYRPILASDGTCVAYAAADIPMREVMTDRYVFVIKILAMLFGAGILLVLAATWFAERRLIEPINAMTRQSERFAYASKRERLRSIQGVEDLNIRTGNEIEQLYHAVTKSMKDVTSYINTIDQLQVNTLWAFAAMVESRDQNTGEHIKRTAALSRKVAEQLLRNGDYPDVLTEEWISSMEKCAPLHDVGKIKISDTVLNKPGKLTPEEFELMKTHTTAGREIIQALMEHTGKLGYLSEARDMAAYHHEWWDGTGYPEGLQGDAIPLSARIMAVADVYDALTSKRSYKEAFPAEKALKIIEEESGTHFDPLVAKALIQAETQKAEQD